MIKIKVMQLIFILPLIMSKIFYQSEISGFDGGK
jgi:hypothetical protein